MAKILFVDDEPDLIFLVTKMLKKEGYGVATAYSGEECLEILKKEKPDLILLDVMMQGIDGWEVCKKIKENKQTKNIPVVMLTVRTSDDSKRKSFDYAHCDAHIDKPFAREELIATIKKLLEK